MGGDLFSTIIAYANCFMELIYTNKNIFRLYPFLINPINLKNELRYYK